MLDFPCIILAGGKSSRMGEDKALLDFHSKPLAIYQFERMQKIFTEVYISAKEDKFPIKTNLLIEKAKIHSPMIALEYILKQFNKPVFILSVDMPFIQYKHVHALSKFACNYDVVLAKTNNTIHQLCGFYDPKLAQNCSKLLAQDIHKIHTLTSNVNTYYLKFEDEDNFSNLNYFEEYKKALVK